MSETVEYRTRVDRRGFLRTAIAAAAGATAAGAGGLAYLQQNAGILPLRSPKIATITPPLPSIPQTIIKTGANSGEIMQQLIAAHAENMRLQTELNTAQQRLESLTAQNTQADPLLESLESRLGEATFQIGSLTGLVSLYEQLEGIELDTAVNAGISHLTDSVHTLTEGLPTLNEAIQAGHKALNELEAQIPLLDNGRLWLEAHLERLQTYFNALENVLAHALDDFNPFLQMLNDWFQSLLKWLPFGLGEKASQVMASLTDLVSETPSTLSGLHTNVSQPLAVWLADDGGEKVLQKRLVRPLREKTIASASAVSAQAATMQTTYQQKLVTPTTIAIQSRQQVRQLISAYREQHQI